jgi:hypothetical protein
VNCKKRLERLEEDYFPSRGGDGLFSSEHQCLFESHKLPPFISSRTPFGVSRNDRPPFGRASLTQERPLVRKHPKIQLRLHPKSQTNPMTTIYFGSRCAASSSSADRIAHFRGPGFRGAETKSETPPALCSPHPAEGLPPAAAARDSFPYPPNGAVSPTGPRAHRTGVQPLRLAHLDN